MCWIYQTTLSDTWYSDLNNKINIQQASTCYTSTYLKCIHELYKNNLHIGNARKYYIKFVDAFFPVLLCISLSLSPNTINSFNGHVTFKLPTQHRSMISSSPPFNSLACCASRWTTIIMIICCGRSTHIKRNEKKYIKAKSIKQHTVLTTEKRGLLGSLTGIVFTWTWWEMLHEPNLQEHLLLSLLFRLEWNFESVCFFFFLSKVREQIELSLNEGGTLMCVYCANKTTEKYLFIFL